MRQSLTGFLHKIELAAIWVVRILFAPNHFGVSFFKRIKYAVCGGFMVDQVALYNLDRRDRHEFLSEFDWHRSRHINEPYSDMLNNKLVFSELVKGLSPTPEIFAVKHHGNVIGLGGRKFSDCAELLAFLREKGAFVVKPVCAGKGNDIHVVKFTKSGITRNGAPSDERELIDLLNRSREWLVCEFAQQAEYLREIYPGSANTIRMICLRDYETQSFELAYAVQRIGASWTGAVDNGSQGGLIAKVDISTGTLSEARSLRSLSVYENHPDTHTPIKGAVIPGWEEIKAGVLKASEGFPWLDIIAWDILPTDGGFTVIEANTSSGVNIIQLWEPLRYGRLGQFYREHGVIK